MLTAYLVAEMIRDRDLHEMPRNSFMTKDRPRIFNRSPDIEVLRLRIVSWNEKEAARVFVIKTWRIHKSTGTRRFKRFRQLPNFEPTQILRNRYQLMFLEKIYHLLFPAFVSFQEGRLIGWNFPGASGVRIRQGWIGQE